MGTVSLAYFIYPIAYSVASIIKKIARSFISSLLTFIKLCSEGVFA